MNDNGAPVWLITGCSTGFGRALAELGVARGWRMVVTARNLGAIADIGVGHDAALLRLALDVTKPDQIREAVVAATGRFGQIDVLVNNAGYGYMASVEEGEDTAIRELFDANVFGLFAMTRAVLPVMRRRRSGHVINISSVAGFVGFAASGYYAASKHAVEGWSDSLAAEVAPIGIKVSCVEPGPFRTDWWGRSNIQTPSRIEDYADTAGKRLAGIGGSTGRQPGDPAKAAEAIAAVAAMPDPPRHLVLGAFGLDAVRRKLETTLAEIDKWQELALSTDYSDEK